MAADILILAGSVQDRYLSSRWKVFFDRGFFMNHVPVFAGKQIGWLVSGPLMQLANLRQILEGHIECQQANLAGIVTDECGSSEELDRLLDETCRSLDRLCGDRLPTPAHFSKRWRQEALPGRNLGQFAVRLPARPSILQQARLLRLPQAEPQDEDHGRAIRVAALDPRIPPGIPQENQGRDGQAVAESGREGLISPRRTRRRLPDRSLLEGPTRPPFGSVSSRPAPRRRPQTEFQGRIASSSQPPSREESPTS